MLIVIGFPKQLYDRLDAIEAKLGRLLKLQERQMTIAQNILDAIAAETTVVASVITYIQQLISNGTVSEADGAAIIEHINANRTALEAAITTNTP